MTKLTSSTWPFAYTSIYKSTKFILRLYFPRSYYLGQRLPTVSVTQGLRYTSIYYLKSIAIHLPKANLGTNKVVASSKFCGYDYVDDGISNGNTDNILVFL